MLDPLNLILLAAAALILWKLRSVLGDRTGFERPPFETPERPAPTSLPGPDIDDVPETQSSNAAWSGYATADTDLARDLQAVADKSPDFTARSFVDGAKMAYEMIHEAFAKGDKQTLQPLLTRDVADAFFGAISDRQQAGNTMKLQFVGVKSAKIESAKLTGNLARLTVRFVGEMITATLNSAGAVIDGDDTQVRDVHDVWTFERDVSSKNPNWKLSDTGDDASP